MSLEYEDEAIVLSSRLHGETGAVVHVLTRQYGVQAAHIAGGASRRMKATLQPGTPVTFRYRARSSDQLGAATIEADGQGPDLLDDAVGLLGLQCAALMTRQALPERERHEGAYHAFRSLLQAFAIPEVWPAIYVRYEAGLLEELGYGLDLSACAVSGSRDNLRYVSPKSARAVSAESGEAYKDKLLPLPQFLMSSQGGINEGDVGDGLKLTGFFLERHVFHPHNKPLPEIRERLSEALSQAGLG
jgi:DNA repair protein RecO (recombination protein O)